MKTGVVLISHGSKLSSGNEGLFKIADMLRAMNRWDMVEAAFLQLAEPGFPEVVKRIAERGIERIIVVPLLLFKGNHVHKDIPDMLKGEKEKYPRIEFIYANNIGADERIAMIAADRIHEVLIERHCRNGHKIDQPQAIVDESFEIIDKLVDLESVPALHRPIIKRAIHATGDTEYAYNLIFHHEAVESGIRAIKNGKNIITDVNMVKSGINRGPVEKAGGKIVCKISEKSVAEQAVSLGKTRAIVAIRHSIDEMKDGIVVIGNAPTALFELIELVRKGTARPAMIVGLPVGFVGAVEAKHALRDISIPYITNFSRKGGSAVATSVINAIISLSKDVQ